MSRRGLNRAQRWWLAVALLGAGNATAQEASNATRAEALFQEGRRLMNEGRHAEACPKLAASQKLDPGPGTLMNLAACYEQTGQSASAWGTWKEAETAAERGERTDWAGVARARAVALEPSLSRLVIVVPPSSDVAGLAIDRAGIRVERAEWGTAVPVDPGVHSIVASASHRQPWSTTVSVPSNAATVTVNIPILTPEQTPSHHPQAASSAPAGRAAEAAAPSRGKTARAVGWVLGGTGAATLLVGGAFGILAKTSYDNASSHCQATKCSPRGMELDEQAHARAAVATVLVSSGLVLLGAGAVVYFAAPGSDSSPRAALSLNFGHSTAGTLCAIGGTW